MASQNQKQRSTWIPLLHIAIWGMLAVTFCFDESVIVSQDRTMATFSVYQGNLVLVEGRLLSKSKDLEPRLMMLFYGKVPINTADAAVLETIPGIGPKRASTIVSIREAQGPFASADDLLRVPGIGERRADQLQDHLIFD